MGLMGGSDFGKVRRIKGKGNNYKQRGYIYSNNFNLSCWVN